MRHLSDATGRERRWEKGVEERWKQKQSLHRRRFGIQRAGTNKSEYVRHNICTGEKYSRARGRKSPGDTLFFS